MTNTFCGQFTKKAYSRPCRTAKMDLSPLPSMSGRALNALLHYKYDSFFLKKTSFILASSIIINWITLNVQISQYFRLVLHVQSQQWKHRYNVWNVFKADYKDIKIASLRSLWCLCGHFWTYISHYSRASTVDFEQVNAEWVITKDSLLRSCL